MTLTIAPSDEACQAIVDRINTGSGLTYTLPSAAAYFYELSEDVRRLDSLKVDVIHVTEADLNDTLDAEDPTTHEMAIVIRKHNPGKIETTDIATLKLVARKIWQRVNNYSTSRVTVMECNYDPEFQPEIAALRVAGVVSQVISMRVEVEASP